MSFQQPKILCLFSAPLVTPDGDPLVALNVAEEREAIVSELTACNRQVLLRVGFATIDQLALGIEEGFNILLLSGHGHQDFLLFEDGKGGSQPVSGDYLKRLIGTGGPFELAIVSACHSEPIAKMLAEAGIHHVIAIRCDVPVLDSAAITFIGQFYRSLFRGDSIQKAFEMAKLLVEGNPNLMKIKPQLELMAAKKGEPFVAEEDKFVLLPAEDSFHLDPLISEEVPEGVLSIEETKRSKENLSGRPQSFTGRSTDLHAVINELLANRFVTVTGVGGIGKTTLAIECVRWFNSRGHFPDGTFHIDLRHIDTAAGIIAMLGATLDIDPPIDPPIAETRDVIEWLQKRQCLLLFDNAEEVLWQEEDAVQDIINAIIKFAPQVKLLITSQRPVGGILHEPERLHRVYPMANDSAACLFLDTTKRGMSQNEWRSDSFHNLLEQLGGHPLSITLMAHQLVPGKSLEDLVIRLKKYKAKAITVKSIADTNTEHGESLIASLASAYDNLSDDAKTVFGILSMLPAGAQEFTLKRIFGAMGWEYAQELNDASLAEISAYRRVILLPPVWLFAMSVLTDEVKEQYGPKIVELMGLYAQQFYTHLGAKDAKQNRLFFTMEEPNLRFAVELPCAPAKTNEEPSASGLLAPYLLSLYISHHRLHEAKEVGYAVIFNLKKLKDLPGEANTLKALGDLAMRTDDLEAAKESYKNALAIFQQIDSKLGEANTLKALGDLAMRTDDLEAAKESYKNALAIFQQIDSKLGEANTLMALGDLAMRTDDLEAAKESYKNALAIFQQIDEKLGEANTLKALGDLAMRTADLESAKESYKNALAIFQQIDSKLGEANTLKALGDLAMRTDDLESAKESYKNALAIFQQIDSKLGEANTLMALGDLAMRTDDLEAAKESYKNALAIFQQIDEKLGEANTLKALGDLAMRTADLESAKESYKNALAIFQQIDSKLGEANTLMALGDLAMRTDDLESAKESYKNALAIFQQIDEKLGEANTLMRLGQWFALTDELSSAESILADADTIFIEIEELEGQAEVHMGEALIFLKQQNDARARQELNQCSSIRDKVLAHGEAAQWLILYADNLKLKGFDAGAKICLECAGEFASKARDSPIQKHVEQRLSELTRKNAEV